MTPSNMPNDQVENILDHLTPPEAPIESVLIENTQTSTTVLIPNDSNILNATQLFDNNSSLICTPQIEKPNNEFIQGDINNLKNLKLKNFKNPCIAYLNINSLRGNKFTQLNEMLSFVKPEILCIDETKLTPDFPTAQFHIDGYHYPPFRRDRVQRTNSTYFGGGKIVYVKEDLISD